MDTVSVVVAAFNAERYLAEAIESVISQTYADWELIIVDDESTDGTYELAQSYAHRDERVKALRTNRRARAAGARNVGLEHAHGRFITFLDADDVYLSDRLASMVAGLDRNSHWVAAFHDVALTDQDLNPLPQTHLSGLEFKTRAAKFIRELAMQPDPGRWYECSDRFHVFQCLHFAGCLTNSIMIARDRVGQGSIRFDESYVVGEDTDLWIRIAQQGRMGFLDCVLALYRQHPSSVTRDQVRYFEDAARLHQSHYRELVGQLSEPERRRYREKIASRLSELGYARIRAGELGLARGHFAKAFMWHPDGRTLRSMLKSLLPAPVRRWILASLGRAEQEGW